MAQELVMNLTTVQAAVEMYQAQVKLVDQIWWYFSSVTLATLGFTVGSKRATQTWLETVIISVGYAVFSFGSNRSLKNGQMDLNNFSKLVDKAMAASQDNMGVIFSLNPIGTCNALIFHSVAATTVIVAIWGTYMIRGKVCRKLKLLIATRKKSREIKVSDHLKQDEQ